MSVEFTPDQKEYKKIGEFKFFCIQNFPFIADDFDQMTYYELLCKLAEYIKKLIENNNSLIYNQEEVLKAYNLLQAYVNDYFDNLDVQDEINNSLDSLVKDGTLSRLIAPMISGSPKIVDSVSDLTPSLDKTAIYVAIDTGHKYYWNGTTWVDFGTYQATAIGDDDISSENIKNLIYDKIDFNTKELSTNSSNLFNPNNITKTTAGTKTKYQINSGNGGAFFTFNNLKNADLHVFIDISDLNVNIVNCKANNFSLLYQRLGKGLNHFIIPKENISNGSTGILLYQNLSESYEENVYFEINSIKYTQSNVNNIFFDKNLPDIIKNILDIFSYKNIKNNLDYIPLIFSSWGNVKNVCLDNNNKSIQFIPSTDEQSGSAGVVTSQSFNKTSGYLTIECDIECENSSYNYIYLDINNGNYKILYQGSGNAHFKKIIDLSYYAVYDNMTSFRIIFTKNRGENSGVVKFKNLNMYFGNVEDLEIYAENLNDLIKNIQNKFDIISSDISNLQTSLVSPNGTKFKLCVTNNGELYAVNTLPQKALFIGNSLLFGFGNHGMASYSIQDDYYYKVNQAILNVNPNYTSSKFRGTDWEASTDLTSLNNYLNSLENELDNQTNLVFIQLGDNCNTDEKINYISTKAPALLNKIKELSPNAQIYWVASWYNSTAKQNLITEACSNAGVEYINIADLNVSANQSYIGAEYIDENGNIQTISSAGVASHPGNLGFEKIAERMINALNL